MPTADPNLNSSRRHFLMLLLSSLGSSALAEGAVMAGRKLDFRIGDGFGGASAADITAVLKSAGEEIWRHCPHTRWEVPGFYIYHSEESPITVFDHHADGRVRIGLTSQGNLWAQFAYQFGHEFCHALAGHANDWRRPWIKEKKANHWLEESLCETASLFVLRAMSKTWQTKPPYPNWKSYAAALTDYAKERMDQVAAAKAPDFTFAKWFREHEATLREKPTERALNNVIAAELLPLFETDPAGWEAVTFINLSPEHEAQKSLTKHLADWSAVAPVAHQRFIRKLAMVFNLKI